MYSENAPFSAKAGVWSGVLTCSASLQRFADGRRWGVFETRCGFFARFAPWRGGNVGKRLKLVSSRSHILQSGGPVIIVWTSADPTAYSAVPITGQVCRDLTCCHKSLASFKRAKGNPILRVRFGIPNRFASLMLARWKLIKKGPSPLPPPPPPRPLLPSPGNHWSQDNLPQVWQRAGTMDDSGIIRRRRLQVRTVFWLLAAPWSSTPINTH